MTDPAGNASSTVGLRQPLLLRLLHAAAVLAVFAAWLSGLLSALRHDGRLAALQLQAPGDWIDLHSAIGEITTPIALFFGLYAITVGRWRLRRPFWLSPSPLVAASSWMRTGFWTDGFTIRFTACI